MSYSTGRPYQVTLRFVARDDSSSISGNRLPEVILNKGINLSMLHNHILERIAHVTYLSIISVSHSREG